MALEIATVMSPVGVNSRIIQDGENGYLASTPDEWVTKLSTLIDDPQLREKVARNGRTTVVNDYSVASQQTVYLVQLQKLLQ